jgi:hypothetical protein
MISLVFEVVDQLIQGDITKKRYIFLKEMSPLLLIID